MLQNAVKPFCIGFFLALTLSASAGASLILNLPVGVNPDSLTVSTVATGLSYPVSMQVLPDGSLIAGVGTPQLGTDYLSATGSIVNFGAGSGNSGNTGSSGTTVFSSVPYPIQSIRSITNDLIAVAQAGTGGTAITFLRPGAAPNAPYTNLGSITFAPSNPDQLFYMSLAVRDTPGQAGSYDLFFSMDGDTDHTKSTGYATLGGLASGASADNKVAYNTIDKVTVTPTGGAPAVSNLQTIATGVRNAGGMVFDGAGNLYFDDNGWDIPNTFLPQSTDELNFISASQIGPAAIDFGFPDNYVEYGTGNFIGGAGVPPLVAFQPINGPGGGLGSLGAAEIALAPANFPAGLNNGLFISFYGKWENGGANNTTGPLVYYDFGTGRYSDFILSGQAGIGHINSLTSTADALFLGDINSFGTVRNGPISGSIYEIQANTPEPATFASALTAFFLLLFIAGRRRRSTAVRSIR